MIPYSLLAVLAVLMSNLSVMIVSAKYGRYMNPRRSMAPVSGVMVAISQRKKMPNPDDQYRAQMDEISQSLAEKLVDGGLVNRERPGLNKQITRLENVRDTKRIIWDMFYDFFQKQAESVN